MAAPLSSTSFDVHLTDPTKTAFFNSHQRPLSLRKSAIASSNSNSSGSSSSLAGKKPSLSDLLRPIADSTLSDTQSSTTQFADVLSRRKSTWVNPTKPKRPVLSLHRHKRSPHSPNPHLKDLLHIARKLNHCDKLDFYAALEDIPGPISKENALIILTGLRHWEKTLMFFEWVKAQDLFPMETIFYNVTMKQLRYGRQFQLIEEFADEMISTGIGLDNITYSTIITSAKMVRRFDRAVEWFERMYMTGLMPDEVTYSAMLDVYGRLGQTEEALNLYERGRASGWKPDEVALTVLAKIFGEARDYDGIRYVLQEMKSLELPPNLVVYNTLLEAMGKAGQPGYARKLFEEMIDSGISPNEKTLTAMAKIYGKSKWSQDALQLWKQIKEKNWPMDFILCNALLNMCADLGLVEQAKTLFADIISGKHGKPDSCTYAIMLKMYGYSGDVENAMKLFEELCESGVEPNAMGTTCLIQCLGKAGQFDDLVRVFRIAIERGVEPDDKLCGCLLSVASLCRESGDEEKVLACLELANLRLFRFLRMLLEDGEGDEEVGFEMVKREFKGLMRDTEVASRDAFCNFFIDICRNNGMLERAHELLYLGSLYGLYPCLHKKGADSWCLDLRTLSMCAAQTALEEWLQTLSGIVQRGEHLPEVLSVRTGVGHSFYQGLADSFASHAKKLSAPFRESDNAGWFVASREDMISWVKSRGATPVVST